VSREADEESRGFKTEQDKISVQFFTLLLLSLLIWMSLPCGGQSWFSVYFLWETCSFLRTLSLGQRQWEKWFLAMDHYRHVQ
jgi:hypothetical protein